jgi:transcriptional regulator with XRE-family HTH domain
MDYSDAVAEERAGYDVQWDGERIAALRGRLRLTQAELARQLGIRQQTVSEWETGRYLPRGASVTLLRMAEARAPYDAGGDVSPAVEDEQPGQRGVRNSARGAAKLGQP